jgi:uncharacterized membrane protein
MTSWFFAIIEISVIACAVLGGVFLTFSDFVMPSLDKAETAAGVEVMQIINREVFKSVFMVLFFGMAALSPLLIGYAYFYVGGPAMALIAAGGAIYLLGVFSVTAVFNVPMNNMLGAMDFSSADAASYWKLTYFPKWTFWNWVRAIACAASATCFLLAGIRLVQLP